MLHSFKNSCTPPREVLQCSVLSTACYVLTGEALTQSSLLEADGENGDSMVTMTTTVEPMNLHHAMLRSPGRHYGTCAAELRQYTGDGQNNKHL